MSAVLQSPQRNDARLRENKKHRRTEAHRPRRAMRRLRQFRDDDSTRSPWSIVKRQTKEWLPLAVAIALLSLVAAFAFFLAMGGAELIGWQNLNWHFTPM